MIGGASAWTGTAYSAKFALGTRPFRASTVECSMSAIPIPPIMPPMHWLRVVFGLTMRPAP